MNGKIVKTPQSMSIHLGKKIARGKVQGKSQVKTKEEER